MSSQSPAGPPSETPSGLWTSWVESISKLASDMGAAPGGLPGQAAWQMSPDQLTSSLKQLGDMAAKDSILASILRATDDALNANPLRQVIPVDWAEIARALRTIWLRSISRPESAMGRRRFQYAAGAGHDGHLERGMAALVRVGTARTGGFRRRGQALRRARVAGQPRLSHAEGALPPRLGLAAAPGERG